MTNVIGLFNYRSGSTYVFKSIAHLINKYFKKCAYLGEYFNPIHLDMWYLDNNNDLKYKEQEWQKVVDYTNNLANKNFKNDIHNIDLNYTIKKNLKNLALLNKISSSYALKFCPHHLVGINIENLNNLPNTIKIFVKRLDLEDQCLSFLFARETGLWWSSNQLNYSYNNFTYSTNLHFNSVKFIVQQEVKLDKLSKDFDFNFFIKYEDLTGNPYVDFEKILNLEGFGILNEKTQTTIKLLTKQEKINKMTNYRDFKKDFDTLVYD